MKSHKQPSPAPSKQCPECEGEGLQHTINGRELCDVCQGEK